MSDAGVILRAMEPEDLDFLYEMENDRDTWRVGCTSVPYSRYVLHNYIASASNDIYVDGQVRLIMEDAAGRMVGIADVFDFNAQNRRAEVGIVVKPEYRRRGYAEAALCMMADYSLRTLRLHQLYAIVAADNEASLRLFGKCGYVSCGVMRQWLFDGIEYRDAVMMQKIF